MRHLLTVPKLISVGFHHAHFMEECWEASEWAILSWIKGNTGQKGIANSKFIYWALTIWQAQTGTYYIAGTDRYYNWGQKEPVPCFLELTFWRGGGPGINHIITSIVTFRECLLSACFCPTYFTYTH